MARAGSLLAEAREVGLLALEARPSSPDQTFELLSVAADVAIRDDVTSGERTELDELILEREALRSEFFEVGQKVEEALLIASNRDAYQRELSEQTARLSALSIVQLDGEGVPICPLCDSHVPQLTSTLGALKNELSDVSARISALRENNPRLQG